MTDGFGAEEFFREEDARAGGDEAAVPPPSGWQPVVVDIGDDLDPIPPRAFLLGTAFCREFVSALLAAGATGKTALRVAQLLALATGRPLTGEQILADTAVHRNLFREPTIMIPTG